ncbi:hypothetical protein L596_022066 [Steinernema carpocapsae]|uniref:Uncharacterized protein n=1 Tax=Steinernema carpocapsae TaxID=34508 RepID=A0A4U5MKQ0_STECR|nr:hypothetical protein L596_022066 [Steinernema carpocapsae]
MEPQRKPKFLPGQARGIVTTGLFTLTPIICLLFVNVVYGPGVVRTLFLAVFSSFVAYYMLCYNPAVPKETEQRRESLRSSVEAS